MAALIYARHINIKNIYLDSVSELCECCMVTPKAAFSYQLWSVITVFQLISFDPDEQVFGDGGKEKPQYNTNTAY